MLKVTADHTPGERIRLKLEGRVSGPGVEELYDSCNRLLAAGRRLVLDLTGVAFVGRDGLEVLQRLRESGVKLSRPSRFVAEQLGEVGDAAVEACRGRE
ncbi:MAG TPA: STAS domain-containing protein [Candidatus Polarisedimenticolaceae bacterium]|nr:STAS domain-containing protein [Candidatus Polarisedimenticolaceae bacterium]